MDGVLRADYDKDIVDTEDFNGSVWKMLIGLLDPVFDKILQNPRLPVAFVQKQQ